MLDEAARWDDLVMGLRPMSYGAKGVPARCLVSVGATTTAKVSSEGWRLRLRPNNIYTHTKVMLFRKNHNSEKMVKVSFKIYVYKRSCQQYSI
jgi:hypothetical protein